MSTKALKDRTPYEAWSGRKPNLDHLRVFGCIAHTRVASSHLQKLENRSIKLVHLGCEQGSKAYRLLDPDTGKIYVSRDVKFEEDRCWSWVEIVKYQTTQGATFVLEEYNSPMHDVESENQYSTPLQSESVTENFIQTPLHEQVESTP